MRLPFSFRDVPTRLILLQKIYTGKNHVNVISFKEFAISLNGKLQILGGLLETCVIRLLLSKLFINMTKTSILFNDSDKKICLTSDK